MHRRGRRGEWRRRRKSERHRKRAGRPFVRPSALLPLVVESSFDSFEAPFAADEPCTAIVDDTLNVAHVPGAANRQPRKILLAFILAVLGEVIGGIAVLIIWGLPETLTRGQRQTVPERSAGAVIRRIQDTTPPERRRIFDAFFRNRVVSDIVGSALDYPGRRGPHWCVAVQEAISGGVIEVFTDTDLSNTRCGDCLIVTGTLFDFAQRGEEIRLELGGAIQNTSATACLEFAKHPGAPSDFTRDRPGASPSPQLNSTSAIGLLPKS